MAEETPVSEANLLSLPPEILTEIVALCGRSPRHPRATPAALMSSCRDLYELGQAASTRIAFLVAVFGTLRAIEGSCGWLPLLRRDVLDGLFRRVQGASHPVPRYQLQRLFQRCTNASRTDLLFRILAFTEELYPPPSAKTFSAKHRSGVAEYAETSLGFHVRFTDDCLFIELAFAEPDATGSEAHDRQWAYLVEEGRQAGWEVKDDRPMTALLTLKRKYGLDPNLTVCGLSRNTAALLLKEEDVDRFHDDPLPTFPADCGVEGLSLGYCALIKAIEIEDVQALRRLLSMGVSVVGEDDSFFWQAIRVAREGIVAENATPEEKRLLAHEATGRVLRDLGFNLNAPVVCDDYLRICELLDETYQVNQEFGLSNGRDVLEHFALTGDGTEEVLRTVLSFLEESGWLATPAGRRAITNATSICLERNRIDFYEVFHSFSSRFEETNDGNLLVQLLRGDVDGAQVLAAHGQRLTPQQIMTLINSRSVSAETREFVLKSYPYDRVTLEKILLDIFKLLTEEVMPVVVSLLDSHGKLFPDGTGRQLLLKEFEASTYKRRLIRPLLGPLNESGDNPTSILSYDLEAAIDNSNMDEIRRIMKLGAVLPFDDVCDMILDDISADMVLLVISTQRFSPNQLGRILCTALSCQLWNVVDYILDDSSVVPEITYESLSNCMKSSKVERSLDVFKKLLELAGQQGAIVARTGMARRMATFRGPAWLAEWEEYETRMRKSG